MVMVTPLPNYLDSRSLTRLLYSILLMIGSQCSFYIDRCDRIILPLHGISGGRVRRGSNSDSDSFCSLTDRQIRPEYATKTSAKKNYFTLSRQHIKASPKTKLWHIL